MTEPIVSDKEQFRLAIWHQINSYIRTSRFYVLIGILLAVGGGITAYLALDPNVFLHNRMTDTATAYLSLVLGFASFLVILAGAFFGGDAISTDFGTKTGYFALALPIRRRILLLGRYTAAFLVSATSIGLFYLVVVLGAAGVYGFGTLPWFNVGLSFLFALLLALGVLAFAFFLSSVSKSPAIGLVITLVILILALPIVDAVIQGFTGIEPVFSIIYADNIIGAVLLGTGPINPTIPTGLAIMVGYLVGFLVVALILYEWEET